MKNATIVYFYNFIFSAKTGKKIRNKTNVFFLRQKRLSTVFHKLSYPPKTHGDVGVAVLQKGGGKLGFGRVVFL